MQMFKLPPSELGLFDHRCAMGNFKWRKIIDVWRKWCHAVGASSRKWLWIAPGLVLAL